MLQLLLWGNSRAISLSRAYTFGQGLPEAS